MKHQFQSLILIFLLACQSPISCAFPKGDVVHHVINPNMEIDVYLPPNYNENQNYKSIYFNDGETIFQKGYGWDLHKKLDALIAKQVIESVIVVAVYANGNRNSWYIPYQDQWVQENWGNYTPQAQNYTETIVNEVIPFIEKNYKVNQERAIFGYSLGGSHATWAGIKYPENFSFSVAFSPSYWVSNYAIFKELSVKTQTTAVWFDLGTAEWEYYVPFYQKLQEVGYQAGKSCFYYEVKGGGHTAKDWLQRIDYPLIAFAGLNQDFAPKSMEVTALYIPSASGSGKIYRRINVVLTLANGIKYTPSNTANYTLLQGDIILLEDGTITAIGTEKKQK
jgi:enterochelin esterase-like enzyme